MRAATAGLRGAVYEDPRARRIGDVHHRKAAIAPGAVSDVAIEQRVVQRITLAGRPGRGFAAAAPHARNPATAGKLRLARRRHVDDREDVIGEVGEVDRGVGIAPADIPDAVRPNSFYR